MRQVSSGFIEASLSGISNADAYIDINGTIIDASQLTTISISENIGSSGSFSIGTFNTVEATMTVLNSALPSTVAGMPIKIYFGYYVDTQYEYVPMGTFYAQPKDISKRNMFTTINAHDKSWRMTDVYQSALNWNTTHTAREVLNEIATQAEITLGSFGGLNPSNVTVYETPQGSCRDVVAQMALLTGTNAKVNRTGSLDFIRAYPSTPVEEYGAYNYTSSGFTITSEASANYGRLTVNYKYDVSGEEHTQTFNYTAGTGSNAVVIDSKNIRTQAQTNTLGQMVIGSGFSYYGYNAVLPGQPQIDLGDTISIEGVFGEINNLLVLQASHTFNGAMQSTFSAVVEDQDPQLNGSNISGSISEQVSTMNDAVQYAKNQAEAAATRADEAATSALNAQASASAAATSASNAESSAQASASSAQASANSASASATSASNSEASAQASASSASAAATSAGNAKNQATLATKYANSALDQLSVVQDVVGVLNWITAHGTMTLTSDVAINPAHVYFVVDPTGDYVVGGTYYSIVAEPKVEDISTYYELSVDESVQNYVATHVVVDTEGLWLIPDSGGNKVLIATGAGSSYTTAGTYIIGKVSGVDTVFAKFTTNGATMNATNSTQIAHLGYGSGNAESGTATAPYYTFGVRANNSAIGNYSTAEGYNTTASGYCSHAEGGPLGSPLDGPRATAQGSHAEGRGTQSTALGSHAEGGGSVASGNYSHAQNHMTIAQGENQTALGKYNVADTTNAVIIGNGTADNARSNALTVDWNGNVNIASGAKYKINGTNLSASDVSAVALTDKYTRSSAGDLNWSSTTEGDAKVIAKSALAFWNGAYSGNSSNLSKCSTGNIIGSNGGTMTGQLKTSFKESVAMGSYGASASTVPNLVEELRFSSGCMGSANISTAYTKGSITIGTGWYNFIYSPHRSGGSNGSASGDNCNYGNLLLMGMTMGGAYLIRVASAAIQEVKILGSDYVRTTFTPTRGSSYSNFGGCYYEKYGRTVHVHLGLSGLTASTSATVFTLPSGYRPSSPVYAYGTGGSWDVLCYAVIGTGGAIDVRSHGTYCGADITFMT